MTIDQFLEKWEFGWRETESALDWDNDKAKMKADLEEMLHDAYQRGADTGAFDAGL